MFQVYLLCCQVGRAERKHHGKKDYSASHCGGLRGTLCLYLFIPGNIEEPWEVVWMTIYLETITNLVSVEFIVSEY